MWLVDQQLIGSICVCGRTLHNNITIVVCVVVQWIVQMMMRMMAMMFMMNLVSMMCVSMVTDYIRRRRIRCGHKNTGCGRGWRCRTTDQIGLWLRARTTITDIECVGKLRAICYVVTIGRMHVIVDVRGVIVIFGCSWQRNKCRRCGRIVCTGAVQIRHIGTVATVIRCVPANDNNWRLIVGCNVQG